ncbi:MAG: hypothetical protein D3917_11970 [Candidatus Electrothrix sp. AX5]|nr:hypothetical protein [Candidatus Electrothrix sp. AX5]
METPEITTEDSNIFNAIFHECLATEDEYKYISSSKINLEKFQHITTHDFNTSLCVLEFNRIIEIYNKTSLDACRITTTGFKKYVKDNDIDLSKTQKDIILRIYNQGGGTSFIDCSSVVISPRSYNEYCGFILRELQDNDIIKYDRSKPGLINILYCSPILLRIISNKKWLEAE